MTTLWHNILYRCTMIYQRLPNQTKPILLNNFNISMPVISYAHCYLISYPAVLEVIPGKYTIHTEHLGYVCRSTESKIQVNGWYATGSCETTETCRGIKCRVPGTQAGWSGEGSKIVRYNRTMAMEREREDGTMMFNDLFPLINNKHPPETMF